MATLTYHHPSYHFIPTLEFYLSINLNFGLISLRNEISALQIFGGFFYI